MISGSLSSDLFSLTRLRLVCFIDGKFEKNHLHVEFDVLFSMI